MSSPTGIKNFLLLDNNPVSSFEEWQKACSNPEYVEAWAWLCNNYEMVGNILRQGIDVIDYAAGHLPFYHLNKWREYKPIIYERRKTLGPSFYRNMEYLMDSLEKYFEEHPELAT